jgi:hypothetical protein
LFVIVKQASAGSAEAQARREEDPPGSNAIETSRRQCEAGVTLKLNQAEG